MNPCKRPAQCTGDFGPADCILCNPCSCDVCGATVSRNQIAVVIAYGIETGACDRCRGVEEEHADTN